VSSIGCCSWDFVDVGVVLGMVDDVIGDMGFFLEVSWDCNGMSL